MVKKKDVRDILKQYYKDSGLLLTADHALLREVYHCGKTHASLKRGGTYGKEKS